MSVERRGASAPARSVTGKRVYRKTEDRKQDIMAAVVTILSEPRYQSFSVKEIAAEIGIRDSTLYRHYKSKADIMRNIVEFCDKSIASMFSSVEASSEARQIDKVYGKVVSLLKFAELNPGLTRILTCEALVYEDGEVQRDVRRVLDMAELSIKNNLREAIIAHEISGGTDIALMSNAIMSFVQGRWCKYSHSGFQDVPTKGCTRLEEIFKL